MAKKHPRPEGASQQHAETTYGALNTPSTPPISPESLQVRAVNPDSDVAYIGTYHELIAAGVAVCEMFPVPPRKRRWSRDMEVYQGVTIDHYAVTALEGGRYRVTREMGWQDPRELLRQRAANETPLEAQVQQRHHEVTQERATKQRRNRVRRDELLSNWAEASKPQTAEEFRCQFLGTLDMNGRCIKGYSFSDDESSGYRIDKATANQIANLLEQIKGVARRAEIVREGYLSNLPAALSTCVQYALKHPLRPDER